MNAQEILKLMYKTKTRVYKPNCKIINGETVSELNERGRRYELRRLREMLELARIEERVHRTDSDGDTVVYQIVRGENDDIKSISRR